MFPNPQDALPLPRKPGRERYRILAQDLVKSCKAFNAGDTNAIGNWAEKWILTLARRHVSKKDLNQFRPQIDRWINQFEEFAIRKLVSENARCRLPDARFVIAAAHGFESWSKFLKHVNALGEKNSSTARFESAAEAIVSGDLKTLGRLLREDPKLVQLRSTRGHRATLLHYVSANGIENYRQRTPRNIVAVAKLLLEAGAEVDAEADVYGGGATTLGLAATSVHPYLAGVQNPLMQVLIDYGAELDYPRGNQEASVVLDCLNNGRGEAAIYLAERGARLTLRGAAAVGRLDVIEAAFNQSGRLKRGVSRKKIESAFLYACGFGRNNVVEFLLGKGINLKAHGGDGQTGLHYAVIGGRLETVKLLLKAKAPLEAVNRYGGTVLGQTLWSAAHGGDPKVYSEIIEQLIAAGAKIPERHVPVNKPIDDLLRRHGSLPEPTWYWYGEKPRKIKK